MPAWKEILNETKAAGSVHDIVRRKYLKALQAHTKRNIIIYYSGWLQKPHLLREPVVELSISDADKNGFMSVIHKLDRSKGLDLILHTPGGDMAATESLVDYLHSMFGCDIRAIIPQIAMSGGTIMALACRQIIMGKESCIGPIDPQLGNRSIVAVLDELETIREEIKKDPTSALFWEPVLRKLEPGTITQYQHAVAWSRQMAERFLKGNMYKGDPKAAKKVAKIIEHLTDNKKTKHHGRHISLSEAKTIFDTHVEELEADQKLQDLVLTVHHAAIITLQATTCYKIIENHVGRAFIQQAQVQLMQAQ